MADIIDIQERLQAKYASSSDLTWLICPCQMSNEEGASGMLPLACHDAKGALTIVALVCPDCESEISLVFGRPVTE